MCVAISFRYNIIGRKNPNEMERAYNSVAQKIYNQEINNERKIFEYLQSVYINDEDFKSFFLTKEITTGGKNKKLVKYILTKIENHISNKDNDFNDANFTIEHILPENFNDLWEEVFDGNATKFVYRLGNYTLLKDHKNRECADKNFSDKKKYI